jgi:hypothetical protein
MLFVKRQPAYALPVIVHIRAVLIRIRVSPGSSIKERIE